MHVQHLQQSGAGVTPVVAAHLVQLVQHQHRVDAPRLTDAGDDASGHGPHVGLAVASNLRLVMDAAQGDAGQLPVHGPGHAHGNGGLTHTGRAHQAQHLALQIGGQLLDGHKLQNTLFHLFHAVVVGFQHFRHGSHVGPLTGFHHPGQLQAGVQIAPEHRSLRGAVRLLL